MTNTNNSTTSDNFLYSNCMTELPSIFCPFANVCGLLDAVIWFFVFLPQIYTNFKRKSVEGLSTSYILATFTAAIINFFFVFQWGVLPAFVKVYTCYTPVVQGILLIQITLFTKWTKIKCLIIIGCILIWVGLACLLIFLPLYDYMQWVTVTVWSLGPFAQVFLNIRRQSTMGLSLLMVILNCITTFPYYFSIYMLVLPVQNMVLCFFNSSGAFIMCLQVIMFWKQGPKVENTEHPEDKKNSKPEKIWKPTPLCKMVEIFLTIILLFLLICVAATFIWSVGSWLAILAPICLIITLLLVHFYYTTPKGRSISQKINHTSPCPIF